MVMAGIALVSLAAISRGPATVENFGAFKQALDTVLRPNVQAMLNGAAVAAGAATVVLRKVWDQNSLGTARDDAEDSPSPMVKRRLQSASMFLGAILIILGGVSVVFGLACFLHPKGGIPLYGFLYFAIAAVLWWEVRLIDFEAVHDSRTDRLRERRIERLGIQIAAISQHSSRQALLWVATYLSLTTAPVMITVVASSPENARLALASAVGVFLWCGGLLMLGSIGDAHLQGQRAWTASYAIASSMTIVLNVLVESLLILRAVNDVPLASFFAASYAVLAIGSSTIIGIGFCNRWLAAPVSRLLAPRLGSIHKRLRRASFTGTR
jgi:hypothetical protein